MLDTIKQYLGMFSLDRILPALLALMIGLTVAKILIRCFDRALGKSKLNKTMFSFLKAVMRILLYSIAILIAADFLGVDVTSLIAVLSVVSLAVSLAVQNALTNVVGSMSLLATQPFQVGDFVDIGGDSGTVQEITLNYTRLLTTDGRTIYIPNSDAATARICNYSVEGRRRVELCFTAAYEDDIDTVKEAILRAAEHRLLLSDPEPTVILNAYLDSAIEYKFLGWTTAGDYFTVKNYINEEVKREFDKAKISIPFPQMDVHLQK